MLNGCGGGAGPTAALNVEVGCREVDEAAAVCSPSSSWTSTAHNSIVLLDDQLTRSGICVCRQADSCQPAKFVGQRFS